MVDPQPPITGNILVRSANEGRDSTSEPIEPQPAMPTVASDNSNTQLSSDAPKLPPKVWNPAWDGPRGSNRTVNTKKLRKQKRAQRKRSRR